MTKSFTEEFKRDLTKLRFESALQMLETIHSDLCNESTIEVSREQTHKLCNLIIQLRNFSSSLNEEATVPQKTPVPEIKRDMLIDTLNGILKEHFDFVPIGKSVKIADALLSHGLTFDEKVEKE